MKNAVCGAALCILSAPVFAGWPLTTEDAGYIEKGGFEVESFYLHKSEPGAPVLQGLHIQPSAGLGFNTQLGITFDYAKQYSADYDAKKSSGAYALVGKTGIKDLTDEAYGVAVAYGAYRVREVGGKYQNDYAYVNGVLSVPVDKWQFNFNLGMLGSRLTNSTSTIWAISAERSEVIGALDLAVETYGNDHESPWVQVAARWVLKPDTFFLGASYGVQTGSTRSKLLTLGGTLSF
jgi:hypothetical protein